MKKLLLPLAGLFILGCSQVSAISFFDNTSTVYTRNEQNAVVTDDICATNPLRCGMNNPGESVQGLYYNGPISTVYQAQNQTLGYVHNLINRALSLLGLIALGYLVYYGYMIVASAGDDGALKKAWAGLRTTAIAIAGIALSWFLVSFIVYLIDTFILY